MKRNYQKPAMSVVMLGQMSCLMQTSEVDQVSSSPDIGMRFGGAGNGESRVKGQGDDDWYDDWED